jgi:hypothetical protein
MLLDSDWCQLASSSSACCVPRLFARKEEINPMVNRRYVVVADPVAASFQQAHTHHLFNIVIESWCYSLIVVAN